MKQKKGKVFRPRLPQTAREKLKSGGRHKDKRAYDRKKEKTSIQ